MQAKILVVDDEPLARRNISIFLRENGYQTVEARDGKEALAVLQNEKVDLVITDIRMPQLNGLLLRDIIASTRPGTPTLLVTAYYGDLVKARLDPDAFVLKPIVLEELLERTQKLLARA
ncbi:MAG TPA: response regulator [Candidatus Acidoferrales bacterium]|nr:response regulator [Candidatus Acidoferrales bacterium]